MGSFCAYQGIVGIHTSEPYIYSDKHRYWKRDAVVPVVQTDVPVDVLTFGGEAAATEDSIYYITARAILQPNPKSEEVNDIEFGASKSIFTVDTHPLTKLSHFNWSTKGKGKWARYDSDDDKSSPIASSSQTIT
ncbi:hypothetical protein SCLCIDRAFT_11422 [Scleroderma citrinum Foug A]|uniref:Uncharacterized protein n=1 Tax=Scleroderma citrinum Foug A TaxID=1036808 RepID=A0A0C3DD55_9AGAM|nr:hypothetical protein SCLCIDRAFT_11422 [Scleroderma citrinum Foug A]